MLLKGGSATKHRVLYARSYVRSLGSARRRRLLYTPDPCGQRTKNEQSWQVFACRIAISDTKTTPYQHCYSTCTVLYTFRLICGRIGVPQEEGHTGVFYILNFNILHLPTAVTCPNLFNARKIQPSLYLVDREVEFCVTTERIVLHLLSMM